jgi:hypothetical protein
MGSRTPHFRKSTDDTVKFQDGGITLPLGTNSPQHSQPKKRGQGTVTQNEYFLS